MTNQLTIEQFQRVLPKDLKRTIDQDMVDSVNKLLTDPLLQEVYRDNLLSYIDVLQKGRFKLQNYIDAVRYVSFKLAGDTNIKAWVKTFPDKYKTMLQKGFDEKTISAHVVSFNKSKLVNLIFEQTLVPTHVLNADIYQKAINTQAELMITASSEKVRTDAANSLLHHLKPPETKKIELDITQKESSSISELRDTTMELVAQQKRMLASGMINAKDAAHSRLITETGEVIDD